MRMSVAEMKNKLVKLGLKRRYKPIQEENETETILLGCRKPAEVVDGVMKGAEIDVFSNDLVRIWTSQKAKAMECGRVNRFKTRLLDYEAEVYVPIDRADEFLHGFGAKVRKELSMESLEKLRARAKLNNFGRGRR